MNHLTALPSGISIAWSSNRQALQTSGRIIDEEFIRRGFSSTKALIDFKLQVYGPGTYEAFLAAQSGPEGFEAFRVRDAAAMDKIKAARNGSPEDRARACDLILNDAHLTDQTKDTALAILCEMKRNELFFQYSPLIQDAQISEQNSLCTLYRDRTPLLKKETAPLRKEAYNSVMADAFGALGFAAAATKRGVAAFTKKLSEKFSVWIEADAITMERDHSRESLSPLRYWPIVGFDSVSYLGAASKREKQRYLTFLPVMNCVAASQLNGYDDTSSLEIMIRRQALWYELTIKDFEKIVSEFG